MDACIFTISVLLYLDDFFYSLITGFLNSLQSLLEGGLGGSAVELSVIRDAGEGCYHLPFIFQNIPFMSKLFSFCFP